MTKSTHNQERVSHSFLDERITFDRFVRGLILVLGAVGLYYLIDALSGVLWPFFVAWLFAYLIHSIRWLDECENRSFANFHLVFLMRLSRFLGLYPNVDDYI